MYKFPDLFLQGLVMLERETGKVVILTSQVSDDSPKAPGSVINYANDVDIAKDGTVYFTTSVDIPVVPNVLGFWDTFAVFSLTMLQVCTTRGTDDRCQRSLPKAKLSRAAAINCCLWPLHV